MISMTDNIVRKGKGSPDGGQFAKHKRSDAGTNVISGPKPDPTFDVPAFGPHFEGRDSIVKNAHRLRNGAPVEVGMYAWDEGQPEKYQGYLSHNGDTVNVVDRNGEHLVEVYSPANNNLTPHDVKSVTLARPEPRGLVGPDGDPEPISKQEAEYRLSALPVGGKAKFVFLDPHGNEEHDVTIESNSVESGHTVVSLKAQNGSVVKVDPVMYSQQAIDIREQF